MRVWIDNTELETTDSVRDALDQARALSEQSGRLIIDIVADGELFDITQIDDLPTDSAGIDELRLTTTDQVAFLVEVLTNARESLALVREDQGTAADHLRTGEIQPAAEALHAVLSGWQAVGDIVGQSAELADIDLTSFEFGGCKAYDCVTQLGRSLGEIRTNFEQEDWSSLGDTVEYDLDEQAQRWDAMIGALTERVRSGV